MKSTLQKKKKKKKMNCIACLEKKKKKKSQNGSNVTYASLRYLGQVNFVYTNIG